MTNTEIDNVIMLYKKYKELNKDDNTSKKIILYNLVSKIIKLGSKNIDVSIYKKEKKELEKNLKNSGITIED